MRTRRAAPISPVLFERLDERTLLSSDPFVHPVNGVVGVPVKASSLIVSNLTKPVQNLPTNIYTFATWGDGTTSPVKFTLNPYGSLGIYGEHVYTKPGQFLLEYFVANFYNLPGVSGPQLELLVTVNGNSAPGQTLIGHAGAPVGGLLASFSGLGFAPIASPATTLSRPLSGSNPAVVLKAMIDWGDGTSSLGQLRSNNKGGFDIIGAHTYATASTFRITISLLPSYDNGHTFADTPDAAFTYLGVAAIRPALATSPTLYKS